MSNTENPPTEQEVREGLSPLRENLLGNDADHFTKTKVKSWLFEDWKRDERMARAGFVCNLNELKEHHRREGGHWPYFKTDESY